MSCVGWVGGGGGDGGGGVCVCACVCVCVGGVRANIYISEVLVA